jgi:hypothetical protein
MSWDGWKIVIRPVSMCGPCPFSPRARPMILLSGKGNFACPVSVFVVLRTCRADSDVKRSGLWSQQSG